MSIEAHDISSQFFDRASLYLERFSQEKVATYSTEEYFTLLLQKGIESRNNGNYGIAAAYIVRSNGVEIIFFGQNSLISEGNPHGHAEMNAIKKAVELLRIRNHKIHTYLEQEQIKKNIVVRKAPHDHFETILFTTMEPCPMCTVGAVINTGVQSVIVGTEDYLSGQLEKTRFSSISPLWRQMGESQNLRVVFAQSDSPQNKETYISEELMSLLNDLFFQTKEPLDAQLRDRSFLNSRKIGEVVSNYFGSL